MITGIAHIGICVNHIEAAVRYFEAQGFYSV